MKIYKIKILEFAYEDMRDGEYFYKKQSENLGTYFVNSILNDIESLSFYGGIHSKHYGFYRMLTKRFPYAVYYEIQNEVVVVFAVLDLRSNPKSNMDKLLVRN